MRKLVCRCVAGFFLVSAAHASTFYIDAAKGNDANPGTSAEKAWASLTAINQHTFAAGDKVLLHAGERWMGVLELHGSGSAANPILLSSYGEGNKPLIQGGGADAALVLRDVSGWTVENIAVTNHGEKDAKRIGVLVQTSGNAFAIHITHVDVSDVNGLLSKNAGGIGMVAAGTDEKPAHFDDVLIDHCKVSHMAGEGIWLQVTEHEQRSYLNTHVRITGNTITDIGKNAMYIRGTTDGLIDNNVVSFAGAHEHGNAICIGWAKHTTVRNNEIFKTGLNTGNTDNGAIDVDDGAIDAVVEYNWSHDNVGGAINVYTQPDRDCDAVNTIIRYNLSENDGLHAFAIHGHGRSTAIYNNTAFLGKGHSASAIQTGRYGHYDKVPDGVVFARNVFFNEGELNFNFQAANVAVDGNCYFGNKPKDAPADKHVVLSKAASLAGAPIHDRSEAKIYAVPAGSACGAMQPALPNQIGVDFMGTPVRGADVGTRGAIAPAVVTP